MTGISISWIELLTKGIPESFLLVYAVHIFTGTKIHLIKYVGLTFAYILITYLIRFLPITLGINTMLSLLILILLFLLIYKLQFSKVIKAITSVIMIAIFIIISEILNMLFLILIFGQERCKQLLTSSSSFVKSLSEMPSTMIFAMIILVMRLVLSKRNKDKKVDNGKNRKINS